MKTASTVLQPSLAVTAVLVAVISTAWTLRRLRAAVATGNATNETFPLGVVPMEERTPVFDPWVDWALIFSLPKVASSSFWVAVGVAGGYFEYVDQLQDSYRPIMKTHEPPVARDYMRKAAASTNQPIWLFTMVRNPFSQKASMYFEDIEMQRWPVDNQTLLAMNASAMHDDFLRWLGQRGGDTFYSELLENVTGVRMTDYAFPESTKRLVVRGISQEGHAIIVVLVRFEDKAHWPEILRPIMHWFFLCHKQDASELWYHEKYEEFKRTFRWPPELAERSMQDSMMHFYPEENRSAFLLEALREKEPGAGHRLHVTP